MIRDLLILPDGREIFSGGEGVSIRSLTYTRQVSAAGELDFNCAAAAEIKAVLVDTSGSFTLPPDTALEHYRVDEKGERLLMGTFYVQKPTRPSLYTLEFTAYDAMVLAERDLSAWLLEQTWPMTIQALAEGVCGACGLPLGEWELCCGSQPVRQFYQQVTGRQLIAWVAEANGVFAYITPAGALAFASMEGAETPITLANQKSRKLSDAPCAPIDRVAICQEVGDVGVVFPQEGSQTYTITANPLLAQTTDVLEDAVRLLHVRLMELSYTPMETEVFADTLAFPWQPGQLVTVETGEGSVQSAVFTLELTGNLARLKSWGQPNRDSAPARYSRDRVKILQKQMTQVKTNVEEVSAQVSRVEAEFTQQTALVREDISALQVASDGINAQVSRVETAVQTDLSLVQQSLQSLKKQAELSVTADQMALAITTALEDGTSKVVTKTGYTFDEEGLSIATSRSDIQNLLDHNGMEVTRGGEVLLKADAGGVEARDVRVGNYLVIGSHARVEDYQTARTACFWL